jgi:hypothetical protein
MRVTILDQFYSNAAAVLAHTKTHTTLMSEHGVYVMMAFYEGWAMSSSNGVDSGIALMQQGLALLEAKNVALLIPHYMDLLA